MTEDAPEAIGRYRVRGELGRGGMAVVYLAYDPHLEREVAIKVLPRELVQDDTLRARFTREARTIARLRHEAIVRVHDFGEHDGRPFLVLERMSGGSLADRPEGARPIAEVVAILGRVASGLDTAHRAGIVHRDLKPANILFDDEGGACIADFGIAAVADSTQALTGTKVLGTPSYMSPEQANGEKATASSDIYSLGIIAYQMLTGGIPFAGESLWSVLRMHIQEPPPPPRKLNPDLPVAAEIALMRCLAKTAGERYPTAVAFIEDLATASGSETVSRSFSRDMPTVMESRPPSIDLGATVVVNAPSNRLGETVALSAESAQAPAGEVERVGGEDYFVEYDPSRGTVVFSGMVRLQGTPAYEPMMGLLGRANQASGPLTVDFRNLQFLNSSGISAISRFVIAARKQDRAEVTILGSEGIYWQRNSLTNLQKLWPKMKVEIQ